MHRLKGTRSLRRAAMCAFVLGVLFAPLPGRGGEPGTDPHALSPAADSTGALGDTLYFKTTSNGIGLRVNGNGLFGTNFMSRAASFEFPLGSRVDHMPRGGLWVGAITAGGDTLVSTAVDNGVANNSAYINGEFREVPDADGIDSVRVLSTLEDNRYYSSAARSEEDFRCAYADTAARIRAEHQSHRPLYLSVELENLTWSFEPFDGIVFANFRITNCHPTDPVYNVYTGFYSELASGYKKADANWLRGWFRKKKLAYDSSLRMASEHHITFGDGNPPNAPYWAGISMLGSRPDIPEGEKRVSFNWWTWTSSTAELTDGWRYRQLSNGEQDVTDGMVPNDDPVEMISVGPWAMLGPGESVEVSYAFLGGEADPEGSGRSAFQDLVYNAKWAQNAWDLDFRIPLPPPSPRLTVVPGHNEITLKWDGRSAERFRDPRSGRRDFEGYRVYVSEERTGSHFRPILERDKVDGFFADTDLADLRDSLLSPEEIIFDDSTHTVPVDTLPAVWSYSYDITGLRDGFKYWAAVTAFDDGKEKEPGSLESGLSQNRTLIIPGGQASVRGVPKVRVFPNPYRGDAAWDGSLLRDRYLWFVNLPPRCSIRIYTLAGDLVDTIHFDQATYSPRDVRGIFDPTDPRNPERDLPTLSGGMAAWDLVTRKDQGVASGLYLFSVEDTDTGDRQVGKFLVIK